MFNKMIERIVKKIRWENTASNQRTISFILGCIVSLILHVSKEMVKDFKACCDTGGLGQLCTECSWFNVKIGAATVCCIKGLRKEIRRQIEKNGKEEGENNV